MKTYIIDRHTVNVHERGDKHRCKDNLTRACVRFVRRAGVFYVEQ